MKTSSPDDRTAAIPQRKHWGWLVAGLLGLFLFALGTRGLNEPDEGRYANIARAMVLSGDWWEPRMSGLAHYDKPPLIYWTTALAFQLCGFNEWAARLPSLLGAICSLTGLGWAAGRLYGARVAWWAVLICGTSVQFFILARILTPDMLLSGWCALAIGAWAETRTNFLRMGAPARTAFPWLPWSASLAFWTLAWWTKATPALIPMAGLLVGVLVSRDRAGLRALRLWLLLPLLLALGSVWYLSMLHRYPELQGFFFGRELAGRLTGHVHGRRGSVVYYLGVSLVAWLPWWPLALKAAWDSRRRGGEAREGQFWRRVVTLVPVEGWIVLTGLAIFTLASSKLPTYTLPLVPWAALVFARLIWGRFAATQTLWPPIALGVAGAMAMVALAGVLIVPHYESQLGVNSSTRELCRLTQAAGPQRVYSDRYWPGLEFYLDENRVRYLIEPELIRERASDPGQPAGLFISAKDGTWLTPPASDAWLTLHPDVWLLRFRKQQRSPFTDWERAAAGTDAFEKLGDFTLIPARLENGQLVPRKARSP